MDIRIKEYLEGRREAFLGDLKKLVDVNSVRTEPLEGMPFGRGGAEALAVAADIASGHGFNSVNYDNYALEIDLGARPELMLLAHLDVVPEGEGWTRNPYDMTVEGNLVYGRGTTDDKGPALACLYAMEAARAVYGEPRSGVRAVLGSGEETGSEDMDHYFSKRPVLRYTLSPDADYPLINIEKGRFAPNFTCPVGASGVVARIEGGSTSNIVPGKTYASLINVTAARLDAACAASSEATGAEFTYEKTGDTFRVTCAGVSAHAASPEKGNNGNTALIDFLLRVVPVSDSLYAPLSALAYLFPHGDTRGEAVGAAMSDEESGALTMNMGVLSYDGSVLTAGLDLRCPLCANEDNVKAVVAEKITSAGFAFVGDPPLRPAHVVPKDAEIVRECLRVYEDCTDRPGECLAIGGGTYVHDIEGGIAFGVEFPGRDYRIHGADEFADVDELLLTAQMYAEVIRDLAY